MHDESSPCGSRTDLSANAFRIAAWRAPNDRALGTLAPYYIFFFLFASRAATQYYIQE